MSLDGRKARILHAVVNDYVETADPIGSEWLATRYDFGCKSATLRNEMSEMSDLGYLLQPHTSAGRIPSDMGYRFYVDRLMNPPALDSVPAPETMTAIERRASEVDEIVQHTCRLLSGMAQYPSVATPPSQRATTLHRVYLSSPAPGHLLIVLLLSTGHVEHRMNELDEQTRETAVERVQNYLNEVLRGRTLEDLWGAFRPSVPREIAPHQALVSAVLEVITEAAGDLADDRVFLEGTAHILRQREFQDVCRLEQLLSTLQQHALLCQVLSLALLDQHATVVIGSEGQVEEMRDCSVVTSHYWIGEQPVGYLGVVGPTRMNYNRAIGAVGLMARNLSTLLTRHYLG